MNISINAVSMYGRNTNVNKRPKYNNHNSNVSFRGSETTKMVRSIALTVAGMAFLSAISCIGSRVKKQVDNEDGVQVNTEMADISTNNVEQTNSNEVSVHYYYTYSDNEVTGENYSWLEKTYPDGTVEKDSMGYKIIETPNGERTVSVTDKDQNGEIVIKTKYPDGSTGVRIENGINYKDTVFWANGNVKSVKIKNVTIEHGKYPSDDKEMIKNQTYKVYDENGVLLYWELIDSSQKLDENNFKYDSLNRIVDNGFTKYEYEGDSEIPFKVTEDLEGCKYITEYDSDGVITNQYFQAENGIITPYTQIYEHNW